MKEFKPETLVQNIDSVKELEELADDHLTEKVILGLDIYKYSQYPKYEQIYVPVVFEKLYGITVGNCIKQEKFIFSKYGKNKIEFKKNFISTGDGGFQIFDNPIQAIVFALLFQANIKRYCSGGSVDSVAKKLYKLVDQIEIRYAITMESLYKYGSNYFGPAIINNARILSKDSLNRLLIDEGSIQWLSKNVNGVETLIALNKSNMLKIAYFKDFDPELTSFFFNKRRLINSVDLQKVGRLEAKQTTVDIYNLHIQAEVLMNITHHDFNTYVISLGNLNTSGIE